MVGSMKNMNNVPKSFYDVECEYKRDCSGHPDKCSTCIHNKSKKRNYYQPDLHPIYFKWFFGDI